MSNNQVDILRYLIEFRKRLMTCLCVLTLIFSILFYFSNNLFTLLALPLLKHLPHQQGIIATNVTASFLVPFELTFIVSLFIAMPFFIYQCWAFISPALYQHERNFAWPLLFISIALFYCGIAFSYFIIFPILFEFLTHAAPQGVLVSPDISQYLDFTIKLFFIFGIIFEVPVITIVLVWTGITTHKKLIQIRPYAIVSAFIIGMLLAPPDVISQTLFAIPLWLLFETGILLSRFFVKGNLNDDKAKG